MEALNNRPGPDEILQQTKLVFEEREKEFQIRERAFQEKNKRLQDILQEIAEEKKAAEERSRELDSRQERLDREQEELEQKHKGMEQEHRELEQEKLTAEQQLAGARECALAVKEDEKKLLMQKNLELEKVRNQQIRLDRLEEEYEYKLSLMGSGINPEPKAEEVDLSAYILRAEHGEEVGLLESKLEDLQNERKDLLKQIFKLNNQLAEKPQAAVQDNPGLQIKAAVPAAHPGTADEGKEELTAGVLQKYLERNEPKFQNLALRHSDNGEQLSGESGGLRYRFIFSAPSSFDIAADRKKSAVLKKTLQRSNEKFPGVQFRYEEQEGVVYATGFFPGMIKPYELMERVKEISNCFRQE